MPFKLVVPAKTLKACAVTGPHLLAAEGEAGSSGSQSPDLGDMWRYGCPKSSDWDAGVEPRTESDGTSSSEQCEHNVESLALNAMGQDQSVEKTVVPVRKFGKMEKAARGRPQFGKKSG